MSEVYCKNCKYLIGAFHCEYYNDVKKWTGTIGELIKEKMGRSQDCSDYKRKWWKFWV